MDALEVRQDPQTCEELALLLEGQGEHAAASVYFQKGLALATGREEHHEVQMLESPEEDAETIADGARQVV